MLRKRLQFVSLRLLERFDQFADWIPAVAGELYAAAREQAARLRMRATQIAARFRQYVGVVQYQAPPWTDRIAARAREQVEPLRARMTEELTTLQKRRPRLIARSIAAGTLLGFLVLSGGVCALFGPRAPAVRVELQSPAAYRPGQTAPPPLALEFSNSVAPLDRIGLPVDRGVRLDPPLAGRWVWESDRRLTFFPSAEWAPGVEYEIELEPILHAAQFRLQSYDFGFKVTPFAAKVQRLEYYVDYTNPELKRIVATIGFNYPADATTVKENVQLLERGPLPGQTGRQFAFTLDFNESRTEAYIQSENIPPPEKSYSIELRILPGIKSSSGGEPLDERVASAVLIPARDEMFKIEAAALVNITTQDQEIERVLAIETGTEARGADILAGLEAYLLPRDRPESPGVSANQNHEWTPEEIGPEILARSQRVAFELAPAEREYGRSHAFRFDAEPRRRLYVRIARGARNFAGYILKEDFQRVLLVEPFPTRIAIQTPGALLSLQGEKKISVAVSGVQAVKIEIDRVLPDQINHLVSQTGGDFQNPYFMNYRFDESNLAEHFEEIVRLAPSGGGMQYFAFDFSRYLSNRSDKTGLFFLRITRHTDGAQRDGQESEEHEGDGEAGPIMERRFVLVSDLGLLAKEASTGEQDLFIQSVSRGQPVPDVSVQALGKNGLPVADGKTDASGRVSFPALNELRRERTPVAFLLRKGSDVSFMPFRRADRELNLSRFDIGGVHGADRPETLTAFLFSDRGLYRPGETAHIGVIVKSGDWNRRLEGVPLEASFLDARGVEVQRAPLRLNREAFHELKFASETSAPTGVYQVNLYTVRDERRANLLGSTSFRVEEFQPDRLQIRSEFTKESESGWVSPNNLRGRTELRYLFGQPAAEHRMTAEMEIVPAAFDFPQHRGFTFHDPARVDRRVRETLAETKTDAAGRAEFDFKLQRFGPATYRLNFLAQGFEAGGGRSVSALRSVLVSSLERVIGFRADGSLDFIQRGAARSVELIAVGPDGARAAAGGLTTKLVEVRYVSVLARSSDGAYRYTSVRRETPVKEERLQIPVAGQRLLLPSAQPGEYVLYIYDAKQVEVNRINFTVAGAASLSGRMDRDAELQVRLDKKDYAPGETVRVSVVAPYVGAGLITIERDKVYAHKWFQTTTNSAVETITVPEALEGNAYVSVSFIRSAASPEVFTAPLSYGVQPFSISRARRENRIQLSTPDKAEPGKPFPITYSASRPGRIAVFAVDEGILQVARYNTPDPLGHFFRKRALETKTSQILDLILPEFSQLRRSRPGGGDSADLGRNLNPFRRRNLAPAVFWSGIVPADASARTVRFDVPAHFNGALRVMAVAVSDQALGAAEKRALIQDAFVISPSAPLFLAPGDTTEITVGVANNVEGSGETPQLSLRAELEGPLKLIGEATQTLSVPEGRERVARFRVQASGEPGPAEITFTVQGAGRSSRMPTTLSVRPATIYRTTISGGVLSPGEAELATPRRMYAEHRRLELSASRLPLGLARGLTRYLDDYPYGCTEQMVSRAMPELILAARPEFRTGGGAPAGSERVDAAVRVLRARQNGEGAFGFWAANSYVSPYQSVYALHFLTEARERGRALPPELLQRGLVYLKKVSAGQGEIRADARTRAYALYVLARNGQVVSNEAQALRRELERDANQRNWRHDASAVYLAAAFQLMKQEREAAALIGGFDLSRNSDPDYDNFYDDLLRRATYLYVVARHFPDRLAAIPGGLIQQAFVPALYSGRFNSLSASVSVLALDALAARATADGNLQLIVEQTFAGRPPEALNPPAGLFPHFAFHPEATALKLANRSSFPIFYQASVSGFDLAPAPERVTQGLEIFREYRTLRGEATTAAQAGEDLEVIVRLRGIGRDLRNIAVTELLPGGFEAEISSARDENGWVPEYLDVREDRLILYGPADEDLREFRYRICASNPGEYVIPPIYAESMYDPGVRAQSAPLQERLRVQAAP